MNGAINRCTRFSCITAARTSATCRTRQRKSARTNRMRCAHRRWTWIWWPPAAGGKSGLRVLLSPTLSAGKGACETAAGLTRGKAVQRGEVMGLRFRRTMQIIPGLRLNLSRSGPSMSFGSRGFHYTVGMKRTRTTVGIPGSGLSLDQLQTIFIWTRLIGERVRSATAHNGPRRSGPVLYPPGC
jgi:hypothetical protein